MLFSQTGEKARRRERYRYKRIGSKLPAGAQEVARKYRLFGAYGTQADRRGGLQQGVEGADDGKVLEGSFKTASAGRVQELPGGGAKLQREAAQRFGAGAVREDA
ncbi:hypothetical protein PMKS-001301 [Pichia membranifaciens]|uniref:Uncharacterized protein n=1 Tax=Pichia membranifaciens TaxID=4926 RepID=A0A1Q2YEL9_9ASCO|nr:hypothetical protein PMKS-001301 [Pichia membranifaciens]